MPKLRTSTVLFVFIALTSVTAQTFQYSRGWTNGKRDGRKLDTEMRQIANNLERTLNPCQLNKLKYVLEGKPFNERLLSPCEYTDDDGPDPQPKQHYKPERNQESLFDTFL